MVLSLLFLRYFLKVLYLSISSSYSLSIPSFKSEKQGRWPSFASLPDRCISDFYNEYLLAGSEAYNSIFEKVQKSLVRGLKNFLSSG
jgi:hypothetical protein